MGLERGSYEAYCFNQAIWFFGTVVESEVEKAGNKPAKGEAKMVAAKKRVLGKYLGDNEKQQFADPALLFQ